MLKNLKFKTGRRGNCRFYSYIVEFKKKRVPKWFSKETKQKKIKKIIKLDELPTTTTKTKNNQQQQNAQTHFSLIFLFAISLSKNLKNQALLKRIQI